MCPVLPYLEKAPPFPSPRIPPGLHLVHSVMERPPCSAIEEVQPPLPGIGSAQEMDQGSSNVHPPRSVEQLPQLTPWVKRKKARKMGAEDKGGPMLLPSEPMGVSVSPASHIPRIS